MVRIGALDMLDSVPSAQLWPMVSPLLSDPVRGVRIRAVALLAAVPAASQPPADRERFERAAAEFIAAQRLNADRPEARATLGEFPRAARPDRRGRDRIQGRPAAQPAIRRRRRSIWPTSIGVLGRDGEGEAVLRAAIAVSPRDAGLHHALGLTLTRLKQADAALAEFRQASELEPDRARYLYVYAVALNSAGRGARGHGGSEERASRATRPTATSCSRSRPSAGTPAMSTPPCNMPSSSRASRPATRVSPH